MSVGLLMCWCEFDVWLGDWVSVLLVGFIILCLDVVVWCSSEWVVVDVFIVDYDVLSCWYFVFGCE